MNLFSTMVVDIERITFLKSFLFFIKVIDVNVSSCLRLDAKIHNSKIRSELAVEIIERSGTPKIIKNIKIIIAIIYEVCLFYVIIHHILIFTKQ